MLRLCIAVMLILASLSVQAQTIILGDTIKLRDTSVIVCPIEPSHVARAARATSLAIDAPDASSPTLSLSDSILSEGYISQSFSGGNNHDISPNTTADLSLSATIVGGLEVGAHVVDCNMPIDDNGVTNQINELSSILITAKKDSTTLSIGDIVAQNTNKSLSNFSKKIKGVEFSSINNTLKGDTIAIRTDFAATKGKFIRQQFYGQNNSQGPYYLHAQDSTTSVIVLIGTEKVWLNGVLLARGEDADYIIDYNAGCITFNIKHLITSQSIITVDFEYSETQYNNYFIYTETCYHKKNTTYTAGYLSDFDGKNNAKDSTDTDTSYTHPKRNDYIYFDIGTFATPHTHFGMETMYSKITTDRMLPRQSTTHSMAIIANASQHFGTTDTAQNIVATTQFKYLSAGFKPLVTEKDVTFQENWNLQNYQQGSREFSNVTSIDIKDKNKNIKYILQTIKIDSIMYGHGHSIKASSRSQHFYDTISINYFGNNQSDCHHNYMTAFAQSEFILDSLTLGTSFLQKSRNIHDSAISNYRDISIFANRKLCNGHIGISATNRSTFQDFWNGGNTSNSSFVTTELLLKAKDKYSLHVLEILRTEHSANDNSHRNTFLTGCISFTYQLFNNQLILSTNQQSERGNQEQMGYKFIRTSTGNGHYVWNDYNNNGIEELNEFETSYYKTDANYVKYFVHTGKYVNTIQNYINFNASFAGKQTKRSISNITSRIHANISLDIKHNAAQRNARNIFYGDSLITKIIRNHYSSKIRVLNFLFIGNNLNMLHQEQTTYYGFESSINDESSFFTELDFKCGLNTQYQRTYKKMYYNSEYFSEKCRQIYAVDDAFNVKYNFKSGFTPSIGFDICSKKNTYDMSWANTTSFNICVDYNKEDKGNISLCHRVAKNVYNGNTTASASTYQMLEGLATGLNNITTITASYMITKYLQLSLMYELRVSSENTLHSGEMELKLIF